MHHCEVHIEFILYLSEIPLVDPLTLTTILIIDVCIHLHLYINICFALESCHTVFILQFTIFNPLKKNEPIFKCFMNRLLIGNINVKLGHVLCKQIMLSLPFTLLMKTKPT